ncbi:MAG: MTH1187 family thiamine-binding protein [Gemmatimonadota bacterium]|nr:MAG: MTH1187 family thiamine-binding protein [Gemmatimonadota bacterium]
MLAEFSVFPIGRGEGLSQYVSQIIKMVDESGLEYRLNPMGTVVEGEWDEVFDLIKRCHHQMRQFSTRVITNISVDDRKDAVGRITGKIESVEKTLGREIKK